MQNVEARARASAEARKAFGSLMLGQWRQVVTDGVDHAAATVVDDESPFAPEAKINVAMRLEQAGQASERLDDVLVPMLARVAEGSLLNWCKNTSFTPVGQGPAPLKKL